MGTGQIIHKLTGGLSLYCPLSSQLIHRVEQHADNAQQAFSSDTGPSLHLALPALEGLHKAWTSRSNSPKYSPFHAGLAAATNKIQEYYEKSAECDAYIIGMSRLLSSIVCCFCSYMFSTWLEPQRWSFQAILGQGFTPGGSRACHKDCKFLAHSFPSPI